MELDEETHLVSFIDYDTGNLVPGQSVVLMRPNLTESDKHDYVPKFRPK